MCPLHLQKKNDVALHHAEKTQRKSRTKNQVEEKTLFGFQ
jgi:hypothetical protein